MFKARAPETDDLKDLIEQSKHPLQKKLEYDLTRPDYLNRKIFSGRWCGLITEDRKTEIYPPLTPKEKLINFTKEPHKWKN